MQTLYLLDRKAAVRMAQMLQERGVIICQSNNSSSSGSLSNSFTYLPGHGGSFSNLPRNLDHLL
jgi:hypothetical protein